MVRTPFRQSKSKAVSVEFSCHAPEAQSVFVSGDFNDWKPSAVPLKRKSKGRWAARIKLLPGRYEYKFVVDGVWDCMPGCVEPDVDCTKCVPNALGTMNRVVEVAQGRRFVYAAQSRSPIGGTLG